MNKKYIKRLKSFAWRLGAMAFVTIATYIIDLGDVFAIDWKAFTNFAVMTVLGLVVAEVTKYYNS